MKTNEKKPVKKAETKKTETKKVVKKVKKEKPIVVEEVKTEQVETLINPVKPIIVEEMTTPIFIQQIKEKVVKAAKQEKKEILSNVPLPAGYVRCIALKDYLGMLAMIYEGDIIDLPERRFKSLSFRGLVKEYRGNENPSGKR